MADGFEWTLVGFEHAGILVDDAEYWSSVYAKLGATVTRQAGWDVVAVKWGNLRLALLEENPQLSPFMRKAGIHGFRHLGIGVKGVEALHSDIIRLGVKLPMLSRIREREDAFGDVRPAFTMMFDEGLHPLEANFYEFVEVSDGDLLQDTPTVDRASRWTMEGLDHVAIAVDDIDRRTEFYTNLGATIVHETQDSNPGEPSSMHLRGLKWGTFRIALIEGIDRGEESQVSAFMKRNGGHSFQHLALRVSHLEPFVEDMMKLGVNFLGPVLEREDAFGPIKQVFACGFDGDLKPAERNWYEITERPGEEVQEVEKEASAQDFDPEFARLLFGQVKSAQDSGIAPTFVTRP